MKRKSRTAAWLIAAIWFPSSAGGEESSWRGLMRDLQTTGIELSADQLASLSPPILDPHDADADRSDENLNLAGGAGWKHFSRDSVVAPVRIDLDYLRSSDGKRLGQRVHLAFVVHAGIETLRDADMMRRLLSGKGEESEPQEGFHSGPIEREVLHQLGMDTTENEEKDAYSWLGFVLLKKVELQGVIRSERSEGDRFFAIAWTLDQRFTDRPQPDQRYRNEWLRRGRDELGNVTRGEPSSYGGAAGYLVVSGLAGIEEACLVEAEIAFAEPTEWFSGSNLLRSKLPVIIQESARRFRRGLK